MRPAFIRLIISGVWRRSPSDIGGIFLPVLEPGGLRCMISFQ
jgi:hypothetical protein